MANNAFSTEEIVLFDRVLAGFGPNNITARQVAKFMMPGTQGQRAGNTMHRPIPYISTTKDGLKLLETDFTARTQLSVPSTLDADTDIRNVAFHMNAVELRDENQRNRIADSAVQKLSAVVDVLIATRVALQGTLVVTETAAITKYDQVVKAEELMTLNDVPIMDARTIIMNPVDYNGVAGELATRNSVLEKANLTAFERSKIPNIATFESFKANFMKTLPATTATGPYVINANQKHVPLATDASGNVDNRSMILNITGGTNGFTVGDSFTIEGINALSLINKEDTGNLQTFRVLALLAPVPPVDPSGNPTTQMRISPAIVTNKTTLSPSQAEKEYANCSDQANTGNTVDPTNIATARTNIFFHNESVELVHGSLATMDLNGAGVSTMRRATDSGIEILFAKGSDIKNLGTEYRLTMWVTPNILNPQMCGIIIGGQT